MMRLLVLAACSILFVPSAAVGGEATLHLLEGPGLNVLQITLDTPIGKDTEPSTMTGSVQARFGIDPDTDTASQLTLVSGDLNATDVTFFISFIFVSINVSTADMGGTVFTMSPPGLADPGTATFDASLHQFLINRGSITGTAVGNPVNVDLAESTFAGTGEGTGSFVLTRRPDGPTAAFYDATLTTPVNITKVLDMDGSEVTVTVTGTLTAATLPGNPIQVSFDEYLRWTECEGIPGAPPEGDANGSGVPNGLTWALGLTNYDDPKPFLPRPVAGGPLGFDLALPAGGTAGPITVEISHSLTPGSWSPAPPQALSLGVNPIPAGSSGTATLSTGSAPACFVRLSVTP